MSTKNLLNNLKNNHRLIIVVILLIILVVLAHRYQREHFQEVNINSLAKAGSVGSEGPPGEDGEDGEDGDSALNILQKLEAPSDANEKELYDAVFQHGSNATPEGDSAVNILKGLVDHITAKVTRNVGLGVPPYSIIPFHINKSDTAAGNVFRAYLDSEGEDKTNKAGPILIGGFGKDYDSEELLPSGFQVCNGADLQRINAQGEIVNDKEREKTPDFRGRFLMGGGRGIANQNNLHHGDGGNSAGYVAGHFYYQHQTGGKREHTLNHNQMPKHTHKARSVVQAPNTNSALGQGFPNLNTPLSYRHFSFRSTDRGVGGESVIQQPVNMFEGDTNNGPAIAFTGGRDSDGPGECESHNNMPPYTPVLYLIKIKDERQN